MSFHVDCQDLRDYEDAGTMTNDSFYDTKYDNFLKLEQFCRKYTKCLYKNQQLISDNNKCYNKITRTHLLLYPQNFLIP